MKKLVRKKTFGHITVYLTALFFVSILIGVGYAYLNSSLSVKGTTTITKATWDVHFENLVQTGGNITSNASAIESNSTIVNFDISLNDPGDFYEFTVDVKNFGTIDAMIGSIINTGLTPEQQKFLTYTASYSDGTEIKEKQLLKSNQKETIKVYIKFRDDISAADLPGDDENIEVRLNLMYIQADDTAVSIIHPVCKRATTLHTEICEGTYAPCSETEYQVGDTITYGDLGIKGKLYSGDAFDCDVNGDGIYDSKTERFYYVKDLFKNSNYAVLIYYNNVTKGVPDENSTFEYDSSALSEHGTYAGPNLAKLQLPTTSQWKNISLAYPNRDILNNHGDVLIYAFSYAGYSARLLEAEELFYTCDSWDIDSTGILDSCQFFMENTYYSNGNSAYGYWLETMYMSSYDNINDIEALYVDSANRAVKYSDVRDYYTAGVRPVIEVEKSKISY